LSLQRKMFGYFSKSLVISTPDPYLHPPTLSCCQGSCSSWKRFASWKRFSWKYSRVSFLTFFKTFIFKLIFIYLVHIYILKLLSIIEMFVKFSGFILLLFSFSSAARRKQIKETTNLFYRNFKKDFWII